METKNKNNYGLPLVTEEKNHQFTLAVILIAIGAFYGVYKALEVTRLKQGIYDREVKQIASDKQSLEIVRVTQLEKSIIKLELFKIGGIKKKQIDSLRERLFIANQELIMRDSLYIQSRKRDLEKLKP